MICPNCQTNIPDGAKFCTSCGAVIPDAALEEAVSNVNEAASSVSEAAEDIPQGAQIVDDVPDASFDPGAPIAVPKKKEEAPVVPEIAPVESVMPEFPQTEPAPAVAPAPIPAPIPAPLSEPIPSPVATPSLTPATVPAPVVNETSFSISGEDELDKKSEQKALSTGTAFWLMLLFAIPVVGLIASIIASCVGKKCKSRKNFAKAALIWQILAIIIALSLVIVCYFLFREVFDAAMSGDVAEFSDALNEALGL